ncbi:hypothetical protein BKH41_03825 [Helicobacter sp. 12S02232-10]|uniref:hypothetical protein n=1 Tax=Helicobacter sp. 12S02232-10 TaxID=1476197 RepID=UPI000BA5D2D8|nr:hypothetical protein [Helicobacter sp. 12S02232-10]PAF49219.1 hypothetical protein BKH41_03825 [Helicobacter sp. 12S02232-10]
MIPKSLLSKDFSSILTNVGADIFKKGNFIFKGHLKRNAQVLYEDGAIGYQITLLITKNDGDNLRLRDIITEVSSLQNFQIIQTQTEAKVLTRLVLKETNRSAKESLEAKEIPSLKTLADSANQDSDSTINKGENQ